MSLSNGIYTLYKIHGCENSSWVILWFIDGHWENLQNFTLEWIKAHVILCTILSIFKTHTSRGKYVQELIQNKSVLKIVQWKKWRYCRISLYILLCFTSTWNEYKQKYYTYWKYDYKEVERLKTGVSRRKFSFSVMQVSVEMSFMAKGKLGSFEYGCHDILVYVILGCSSVGCPNLGIREGRAK